MASDDPAPSRLPFAHAAPAQPDARVAFRLQRLEPHVAWSLAAYTVWASIFMGVASSGTWLVAGGAAAIGAWASRFPARRPGVLLARALLLLALGSLLMMTPFLGGATGPWALWPLGVAAGYALFLPPRWAQLLPGLALALFAGACTLEDPQPAWQLAFALAGAQLFLPWTAVAAGRILVVGEQQAERARTDRRTQLYNEEGFFTLGAELYAQCRRERKPFTLVLLNGEDLRDANEVLGRRAANTLFRQLVDKIAAAAPPGCLAARTGGVEFAMALPGHTAEKAEALVHAGLGDPPQVEIDMGGGKATVVLRFGAAQALPELRTLEELYDRLHARLMAPARDPGAEAPTDLGTLPGFLLPDRALAQRPTLPMPLARSTR